MAVHLKREVSERVAIDWLMLKSEYLRTGVSLRALAAQHGVGRRTLERAAADGGWAAERRAAAQGAERSGTGAGKPAGGLGGGGEDRATQPSAQTGNAKGSMRGKDTGSGKPAGGLDAAGTRAMPKPGGCPAGTSTGARAAGAKAGEGALNRTGQGKSAPAAGTGPATRHKSPCAKAPPDGEPTAPVDADTLARLRAVSEQLTDKLAIAATQLDKQVLKHKRKTRELVYDGGDPRAKPVEETVEETCEIEIVDVPISCEGLHRLSTTLKNLNDIVKTGGGDGQSVGMVAALMKKLDDEAAKGDA